MNKGFIVFFAVFILCMAILPPGPAYAQDLDQELENVKNQREETSKQIEQTKQDEQAYIGEIEQIEDNMLDVLDVLEELSRELDHIRMQVQKTSLELELAHKEMEDIEKELQDTIGRLNCRVAEIYKNGEHHYLQILMASEDFMDLLSKLKIMVLIAEQDAKIIQEIKTKRQAMASIRQNIHILNERQKEQEKELEQLVAEQEEKMQELDQAQQEKKRLLTATTDHKQALIAMEKQLAEKEAEIKKKLESLRHGNQPQGQLAWPTQGVLISGFGNRHSPIFGTTMFHSGIDIANDTGTPVIAAASGQVIEASHMGGYGNSIMVYHGGGMATFYAHLSSFAAAAGQQVKTGQIIGYIGTTGWTTGPHLHFEVRVNGVAQNPLNFL